jgi:hypothetical protein
MVRRGDADPLEGVLSLTEGGLRFDPHEGSGIRLEGTMLRGAGRLRGSPVLRITHLEADGLRDSFFFFVRPPPLSPGRRTSPLSAKGLRRAGTILTLRAENKRLKPELEEWVRAIRALAGD